MYIDEAGPHKIKRTFNFDRLGVALCFGTPNFSQLGDFLLKYEKLTKFDKNDIIFLEVNIMEFFDDVVPSYTFSCACDDQGCQGTCHGCDN